MRLFLGRAPTLLTVLAVKNNFFGGCGRCNSCRTLSFVITSKVLPIIKSDLEERSRNDVYWSRDPDFIISYLSQCYESYVNKKTLVTRQLCFVGTIKFSRLDLLSYCYVIIDRGLYL